MGSEVKPVPNVIELYKQREAKTTKDQKSKWEQAGHIVKYIPKEEPESLSKVIARSFRQIEQKYYVKIQGEPKVSKSGN